MNRLIALTFGYLLLTVGVSAAQPKPIDAVQAIVDAFTSHDVVALDEGRHRNDQGHDLLMKLIRHPSLRATSTTSLSNSAARAIRR